MLPLTVLMASAAIVAILPVHPLGYAHIRSLVWDIVTLRAVYSTAQCLQHSIVGCSVDGRQTDIALQAL